MPGWGTTKGWAMPLPPPEGGPLCPLRPRFSHGGCMSGMELWWLGQAGFRLRDPAGGPVVFVDPFLSPHDGRTWQPPIGPEEMGLQADLILCTHQHLDHFDQPALRAAAAVPGAWFTLIVPQPIVGMALDLGIPPERVIGAQPK